MGSKVFTGLGAVAFKYYMLFQHQSVVAETSREEPSWLLGASPGPYINEYSRSIFTHLGRKVALLALDCRTERMRDEVLSQESYDIIFSRCRGEIIKGETKHLIVLLGVPIAYPRLNFLENILTSRVMDPVKAVVSKTGLLGGFINKFDGGVEILDDLDDHWTAKHHKQERNWFIQELQELAAEKSVRITILGGDVHLGAVGQFYTPKKFGIPKDQDHRYMPNVVSSAIVNTPPPVMMSDILNKRNKVHHLDAETDEDMIPMFDYDVDGRPRNNHHLLPRRNYCTIREYIPGSTPPPSPGPEDRPNSSRTQSARPYPEERDQRYPPGSMRQGPSTRSRSLTRDSFRPANLIRRLSGSRSRQEQESLGPEHIRAYEDAEPVQGRFSVGGPSRAQADEASYFPQERATTNTATNTVAEPKPIRPVSMFHRRPTDLTQKAASKAAARGGADANVDGYDEDHIDLKGGLDVTLNMEIDQHDPSGNTVGYRLLVPALHYSGPQDANTTRFKTRRSSLMDRIRGRGLDRNQSFDSYSGDSRSPSPESRNAGVPSTNVGRPGETAQQATRKEVPHNAQFQALANTQAPYPEGFNETRKDYGRRRSFMDRIQGRGRERRQSFDSYTDESRSPSPVNRNPSAALPSVARPRDSSEQATRIAVPHNAQAPYADGSSEARRDYGPPLHTHNQTYRDTSASKEHAPGVSGPSEEEQSVSQRPRRRFNFPSFRRKAAREEDDGYGRERYGEESEDQLTEDEMTWSEVESLEARQRERRPSKAERFFGVGNEKMWGGNGAPSNKQAMVGVEQQQQQQQRPGWKVWR